MTTTEDVEIALQELQRKQLSLLAKMHLKSSLRKLEGIPAKVEILKTALNQYDDIRREAIRKVKGGQ